MNILMVEDNPSDVRLVREALQESGIEAELHWVIDGIEALRFLRKGGSFAAAATPDLVLLDLNLPRMGGQELLRTVKFDPELSAVPVVVLSSSSARRDVLEAYQSHANAYMVKPSDYDEFLALVRAIEAYWLTRVALPSRAQ